MKGRCFGLGRADSRARFFRRLRGILIKASPSLSPLFPYAAAAGPCMDPATILELRLEKATLFKNVPEALSDLSSEAYFEFSSTGLELQAIDDTSGVVYVVLELRSEAFDRYFCDRDNLSLDLSLAAMAKVFSFANNDDIITIKYRKSRMEIVTISLESPDGRWISYFNLDLDLDLEGVNGVPVNVPEYVESECQAIVRMPSVKFMRFCNKLSSFWDTEDRKTVVVRISVDKDCVSFFTDGARGSSTIVCPQIQNVDEPKEATHIEMKENVSLIFDLRYMNSLSKASTLSDQVTIKLSSNLPAIFEYKIAEIGYIRYYMMPAKKVDA